MLAAPDLARALPHDAAISRSHIVFIEAGRCTRSGTLAAVTGRQRIVRFTLAAAPDLAALRARLADLSLQAGAEETTLQLEVPSAGDVAAINRRVISTLFELGCDVLEVRLGDSLEQAYLRDH